MVNRLKLRTKITIAVSLLFILLIFTVACMMLSFFEKKIKASISQNQFLLVTALAGEIDKKISTAQRQLIEAAKDIPPLAFKDPESAQVFLDNLKGLQQIFDNQISVLTPDGKIFAESPFLVYRRGYDVSSRPYFKDTVSTMRSVISEPYFSSLAQKHPSIMMTAPILDKEGKLKGILLGGIDLMGDNILHDISKITVGKAGYLFLTTRNDRTVIMHPDPQRILKPIPRGANLLYDKAVDGFEGTGETVNTYGLNMLVSYKRLKVNSWILAANYPVSEAHEILNDLQEKFFLAAALGILCNICFVFYLIKYFTYPLVALTRHMMILPQRTGAGKILDIRTHDEIGTLTNTFNQMISELDQQKEELQKSEKRYRTIYNSSSNAIFIQDIDSGAILDVNEKMCEMYGFSRKEAILINVGDLSAGEPPYTLQAAMEWISKAAQGKPQLFEWKAKNKAGHLFWVLVKMGIVEIDGRDRLLVTVSDITQRKRTESALKESEERFSKAFRSSPAPMIISEIDTGRFIDANERWLRITGFSLEELLGRTTLELGIWGNPDDRNDLVRRLRREGTVKDFACQIVTKSGDVLDVLWNAEKTSVGENEVLLSLIFDNTEKNKSEEERGKLQAQLIQSQKMESVGRLAGGVAHDYNNMLGVIIGHTELAMLKMDAGGSMENHLREIMNAAQRSSELTQHLLAFARRQTIAPRILDLNQSITAILKMVQVLLGENIELVWLPGSGTHSIKIDPVQFNQLLMNICVNARDAISVDGRISIETQRLMVDESYCTINTYFVPGDYALLIVSDNGSGMDKETQSKIFEPFFTTKGVGKGTGLGLATVYGIVKQNNGFINVYSEVGKGTTFKIYFPYCEGSAEQKTERTFDIFPINSCETILVVEDEQALLDINRAMLKDLGYNVLAANTPAKAVHLGREYAGAIDLLMTDVVMPEMNGRELEQRIRESNPKLKCLFASGYTASVISHQGVLDENVNFIQKPFTLQDLALKIREVINKDSDKNQIDSTESSWSESALL